MRAQRERNVAGVHGSFLHHAFVVVKIWRSPGVLDEPSQL